MVEYKVKRTTAYAAVISLALHAGVLLAALWFQAHQPPVDKTDKLLVELYGMIAERQKEEKAPAPAPTPAKPPPTASPPPPAAVLPQAIRKPAQRHKVAQTPPQDTPHSTDSQVQAPQASEATDTPAVPEQAASTSPGVPSEDFQKPTTIAAQDNSVEELKRYLGRLKKKLQAKLVYPDEVKKDGLEGTPVVKFTITADGRIRAGSLMVVRSSGHAMLDKKALEAAEASAPFELPTREMEVAVAVAFRLTD